MDTTKIKAKFSDSTVIKKTGAYYKKHRRFAPLISFFAGFSWDSATLTRIDRLFDNLLMLSYILLLATCILLMHLVDNEKIKNQKILDYREWYPVAMQFFFGSLFSAYVVFYFQSATLSKNWLFLLFLAALLIGNEFLKDYLSNFKLNLILFFLATYSFFIFFVPVLIKIMNVFVFLFSGLLSLLFVSGLIYTLYKNGVNPVWITYKKLGILILTVFLSINILYFLNWIPPVPLSLREGGVYHHVHKEQDQYELRYETGSWYNIWKISDRTFNYTTNDTVFCFASVFAPTKLNKSIYHHWQLYNPVQDEWQTTDRRSYQIVGGREGGYRGYTFKKNIQPGKWRIDVETDSGALLGRIPFTLQNLADSTSSLTFETIYR